MSSTMQNIIKTNTLFDTNRLVLQKYSDPIDKTALAGSYMPMYKYSDDIIAPINIYTSQFITLVPPGGIPNIHPLYAPSNNKRFFFKLIFDPTQNACTELKNMIETVFEEITKRSDEIFTNSTSFKFLNPISKTAEYHDEKRNMTYESKSFIKIRLTADDCTKDNPVVKTPIFLLQDSICNRMEDPTIDDLFQVLRYGSKFKIIINMRFTVLKKRDEGKRIIHTIFTAKQLIIIPPERKQRLNSFDMPIIDTDTILETQEEE